MNRLKLLRETKGWKQEELGKRLNVQSATISKYETGRIPLTADTLQKLSEIFRCTTDYILGISDDPGSFAPPELTPKEERDIAKELEDILEGMNQNSLMFDGEPLDDETRELLKISIENNLRIAKITAKKKYTPKKYRKE